MDTLLNELTVLVIDDEPELREIVRARLSDWGCIVHAAADVASAEEMIADFTPDLVLSDVVMPGVSGFDLLRRLQARERALPVVLMTAHGSIDLAVEAMKEGATDFLTKPLEEEKLKALLESLGEEVIQRRRLADLERRLDRGVGLHGIVGQSQAIRELCSLIEAVASSEASVLITGESGTGKEVVARTVHQLSGRHRGPFLAINSAAMPEGLIESELFGHERGAFTGAVRARPGCFELAHAGTLFLDEITEMPIELQPKLLRVLEDGRVRRLGGDRESGFDVRIVAATNRPPLQAIEEARLREDLYYRLNIFELPVPPLRDRIEDLALLAHHFVREFNEKHSAEVRGVGSEAQLQLEGYTWPGNIRELRNVIERAVILARSGWIERVHLPPFLRHGARGSGAHLGGATLAEIEREHILRTLERVGNNKAAAARELGLDVKTVRNKLQTYQAP